MSSSRILFRLFLIHACLSLGLVAAFLMLSPNGKAAAGEPRPGMWLFAAVVLSVVVVTTYVAIGRALRPLMGLTERARTLLKNEPDSFRSRGTDEAEILRNAFNLMQSKLARRGDQLNANTSRLAAVLGNMVEGVIAVDPKEEILIANQASQSLLEMTVVDPVNRPLLEATRSLVVLAAFREALASPLPVQKEFESAGTERRVLSLRAMRLPGDPYPGVMLVLRDVSELRRLENLRREFVANVSHELKTPLASIKAYAETLKLGALNDPEHALAFVGRIEEQAERLHQLILDLIHIARVESGQQAFDIVDLDVADAVHDCLDQFAPAATARRITLTASSPAAPVVVRADEEGIRTILSNLVDNAIKYTPEGGEVTVRWYTDDPMACLEVQDTGVGIAERDQSRIFERFFRADKARSREVGGTGLGLSIVKHLAQAFGGSVGLESRPKLGSTFRVRLPLGQTAVTRVVSGTH